MISKLRLYESVTFDEYKELERTARELLRWMDNSKIIRCVGGDASILMEIDYTPLEAAIRQIDRFCKALIFEEVGFEKWLAIANEILRRKPNSLFDKAMELIKYSFIDKEFQLSKGMSLLVRPWHHPQDIIIKTQRVCYISLEPALKEIWVDWLIGATAWWPYSLTIPLQVRELILSCPEIQTAIFKIY